MRLASSMTRTKNVIRSGDVTSVLKGSFVFFLLGIVLVALRIHALSVSTKRIFYCVARSDVVHLIDVMSYFAFVRFHIYSSPIGP